MPVVFRYKISSPSLIQRMGFSFLPPPSFKALSLSGFSTSHLFCLFKGENSVSIDGKCDDSTLLGNLLSELKETLSSCWILLGTGAIPSLHNHPMREGLWTYGQALHFSLLSPDAHVRSQGCVSCFRFQFHSTLDYLIFFLRFTHPKTVLSPPVFLTPEFQTLSTCGVDACQARENAAILLPKGPELLKK